MADIFYTSDLHLFHDLVAGLRGFWDEDNVIDGPEGPECLPDMEAHAENIARIWDATVRPQDTLIIAGDVSLPGGYKRMLPFVAERPGHKILVAGNHDPVHPMDRRAVNLLPTYLEVFDAVVPFLRRKLNNINFLVSHFPYMPYDRGPARFEQYRLPDLGMPLVHGHVHSDQKYEFPNQLHVGIDAWGEFVPQHTVQQWLTEEKEKAA